MIIHVSGPVLSKADLGSPSLCYRASTEWFHRAERMNSFSEKLSFVVGHTVPASPSRVFNLESMIWLHECRNVKR